MVIYVFCLIDIVWQLDIHCAKQTHKLMSATQTCTIEGHIRVLTDNVDLLCLR